MQIKPGAKLAKGLLRPLKRPFQGWKEGLVSKIGQSLYIYGQLKKTQAPPGRGLGGRADTDQSLRCRSD